MKTVNMISRPDAVWMLLLACCISFTSCKDDEYQLTKYLKKTYGPWIVGQSYDFSFAMASEGGDLSHFSIEATYPGAAGTKVDEKCYWTVPAGTDYNRVMFENIAVDGNVISGDVIGGIEWELNTAGYSSEAVTARYTYVVPEEARGKSVQFRVTSTNRNGATKSYTTDTYPVETMDIVTNVELTDGACFSISEMKVYSQSEVSSLNKSAAIDFVYRYKTTNIPTPGGDSIRLNACIAAPVHEVYLNETYVPDGWTKNATWIEYRKWDDAQLKGATPHSYVTDLDLQASQPKGSVFGEYDLKADFGLLMQTEDGKYRAYLYVKSLSAGKLTVGVKRLQIR